MGTLTERLKVIACREAEEVASRRQQAADELRTIVLGGDAPKPGDEQRMLELFRELGVRAEEYAVIVSLIEADARCDDQEREWDGAMRAYSGAQAEVRRIAQWEAEEVARIKASAASQRAPHEALVNQANVATHARNSTDRQRSMHRQNWSAFRAGRPIPHPEAMPGYSAPAAPYL